MAITHVKIFGERHTATNAITTFINRNFDAVVCGYEVLGWKHRRPPKQREWKRYRADEMLFIFTIRDPYTWIISMAKNSYNGHQPELSGLDLGEFIRRPFEDYENIVEMWNEKNTGYLKMANDVPNSLFIRMEDFAEDQDAIYKKLRLILSSQGTYQPVDEYLTGMGQQGVKQSIPDSSQFTYSTEVLEHMNKCLDKRIVKRFRYHIL